MEAETDNESSEDESFNFEIIEKRDFEQEKKEIMSNVLPAKSRAIYELSYSNFLKWLDKLNGPEINEAVLVIYFQELISKYKPSTIWSRWSTLRTTLSLRNSINLNNYYDLKMLLKNYSRNYKPKQSKVFTWDQILEFLESDEFIYLGMKVILLFGIFGALRCSEFTKIIMSDVIDTNNMYIISIRDTKNCYPREFVIGDPYYSLVKKYISLRPTENMPTNRFFIQYKKGACTKQVIGIHTISATAKTIATYLSLDNPELFTGHCFRRTSATLLSNTGANLATLKMHGGWRSDAVAQKYLEHSLENRKNVFKSITNTNKDQKSTRTLNISPEPSTSHLNHDFSSVDQNSAIIDPIDDNEDNISSNVLNLQSESSLKLQSNNNVNQKIPNDNLHNSMDSKSLTKTCANERAESSTKKLSSTCSSDQLPKVKKRKVLCDNQDISKWSQKNSDVLFQNCTVTQVTVNNHYYYKDKNENISPNLDE